MYGNREVSGSAESPSGLSHKAAVFDDIGGQNGCDLAFQPCLLFKR
jgi:hypothetical protein